MVTETRHSLNKILYTLLLTLVFSFPVLARASTKILVLLPLRIYADQSKSYLGEGVKSMLLSRLSGGDIEVVGDEKVASLLGEEETKGITVQKRAEELTRRLEADYALFGSIAVIGGGYSLDLSLLEVSKTGSTITRVSKAVDEDQFIPQLSDVANQLRAIIEGRDMPTVKPKEKAEVLPEPQTTKGIFSKVEQEEQAPAAVEKGLSFKPTSEYQDLKPTGTISVGMSVMAFDMGDLDGDSIAELVVLGRKTLNIYQRQGASFALKDSLKPSFGEDFLKVSVGDVDKNGRAEIYLVSRYSIRARSTVLELTGGLKRLYRKTGHLRALGDPGGGKFQLLFQDSTVNEFFSGRIFVMDYEKEGKLKKREQLPELRGVQFYTLASFDLDKDGHPEWLGLGEPGLGEQSRLYVWNQQGDILWSGDKKLGGTNNATRVGEREPKDHDDPPSRVSFNSRLVITDIDGDGNKEILAIENIPLIKLVRDFKVYTKSRLIGYRIEGTGLFPAWTTGDINYCLTDMRADGQTLFLAAQKGEIWKIGKGSGLIMWFE